MPQEQEKALPTFSGLIPHPLERSAQLRFEDANANQGALIRVEKDSGTWTSGSSHPTRLYFATNADGASSPTEQRIDSSGNVGIGTTSPGCLLELSKAGANGAQIDLKTSDNTTAASRIRGVGSDGFSDGEIRFADNGINFQTGAGGASQRARIDAAGNVGIGTTSPSYDKLSLEVGASKRRP